MTDGIGFTYPPDADDWPDELAETDDDNWASLIGEYEHRQDQAARAPGDGQAPQLFRRYTAAELAAMPTTFEWLARGLLARPTYGQVAGEMKTLKTHTSLAVYIGIAAGLPILGHFTVHRPGPVLLYIGEGGRIPYTRLAHRVAAAYGVELKDLPIEFVFDIAPIPSGRFQLSLARDLKEVQPVLTGLDPLYAYHGGNVKASDLHQEGALLSSLSAPCVEAGSTLLANNHFNQTGSGTGLKRITQAGSGEWADSWLLLNHRSDPDVEHGKFWLRLAIGSRQWGGNLWDLDFSVGRFNHDTGQHDGEITWHLQRAATAADSSGDYTADQIQRILADRPWELTREGLAGELGGNAKLARDIIDDLDARGAIHHEPVQRREGKRLVWRQLYAAAGEPRPDGQTELDGVG